ncbi:MAG: iron-sulfur cluster carrier protein ApbC [Gammaproteobacteria bacterium]|nr:iron-sulfur cluster carrier protein ApbC [Gammaproteobacteria bacterium]|tara:strand:+ start:2305 stop:3390 length:1086 start_codon:yes stop_codon:yes gene_type:complete
MEITDNFVTERVGKIIDPNTKKNLAQTKSVKKVVVEEGNVSIEIVLGYPARNYIGTLKQSIEEDLIKEGIKNPSINISWEIETHSVQKSLKPMQNIKNIIAIASGKGGVGKSTTAINLALALANEGATVGILDADIYGPSQPRMMGLKGQPDSEDGKTLQPMENYGVQAMSIGFLIDEETPMIWRGPMVTQALEQLISDTNWRNIDYLVVDLPPGTGDVQLTLAQKIPVSGAVIVTTPQDIALLDARKGLKMFEKVEVPVLGIVENMSTHICSNCGHEDTIFGTGGGSALANDSSVDLLGKLPLESSIRELTDSGKPTVVSDPDGKIAMIYGEIARKTAGILSAQSRDYSSKFPKIVIEND